MYATLIKKKVVRVYIYTKAMLYSSHLVELIKSQIPFEICTQPIDADMVILHITETQYALWGKDSFVVMISGEPWRLNIPVDLIISPMIHQLGYKTIFYPFLYSSLEERVELHPIQMEKTKFCAFMYYQSYGHRDKWFHVLNQYQPVDALGRACNNVPLETTRFVHNEKETYNDIAVRYYSTYQFVLAIENQWLEGYFTEKLINPILAGSIPLYWGHPKVFDYINKKRVIYLPDYTHPELFAYLDELKDPVRYQAILDEPCYLITKDQVWDTLTTELSEFFKPLTDLKNQD